ncbi:hypothetical protein JIX59_06030 [Brevundimonas diminuta]|uniref:hypothetical protein n=1 Tax=Brevundimonas diminuta TaxID=293 RepID=UPI0019089910|nr:hypothetical protein [Brevundimonas diminuta]MBK1968891.1 hypothetical protein [Brevundimonas diminuta]
MKVAAPGHQTPLGISPSLQWFLIREAQLHAGSERAGWNEDNTGVFQGRNEQSRIRRRNGRSGVGALSFPDGVQG